MIGLEVSVFIDCGATHNFIAMALVEKLGAPIAETSTFGVIVGNKKQLKGRGVCMKLILELQRLTIVEDYLPIPMQSSNLILGIKWLATLGVTRADWKQLTLSIEMGESMVTLRLDTSLYKSLVSLKTMIKEI